MDAKTESQILIELECDSIKGVLLAKNRKYGDSAINPKRIFSKASAIEQIKVRLDDKISRLMNQQSDEDEDVIQDLIGYLILMRVAKRKQENENGKNIKKQNETLAQRGTDAQRGWWQASLWSENENKYDIAENATSITFSIDGERGNAKGNYSATPGNGNGGNGSTIIVNELMCNGEKDASASYAEAVYKTFSQS